MINLAGFGLEGSCAEELKLALFEVLISKIAARATGFCALCGSGSLPALPPVSCSLFLGSYKKLISEKELCAFFRSSFSTTERPKPSMLLAFYYAP